MGDLAIHVLFPLQFGSKKVASIHSFAEILFPLSKIVKSFGYSSNDLVYSVVEYAVLSPKISWLLFFFTQTHI